MIEDGDGEGEKEDTPTKDRKKNETRYPRTFLLFVEFNKNMMDKIDTFLLPPLQCMLG